MTESKFEKNLLKSLDVLIIENRTLKAQLEIAKEALKEIESECHRDDSRAWSFASDALEKLKTTGE